MAQDQPTLEGLTADVKVTSERLAQLEGAQIAAEERLKAIEDAQGVANTQLQDILLRLDELRTALPINNNAVPHNSRVLPLLRELDVCPLVIHNTQLLPLMLQPFLSYRRAT